MSLLARVIPELVLLLLLFDFLGFFGGGRSSVEYMVAPGFGGYSQQHQQGQSVLSRQAGHGDPATHTSAV